MCVSIGGKNGTFWGDANGDMLYRTNCGIDLFSLAEAKQHRCLANRKITLWEYDSTTYKIKVYMWPCTGKSDTTQRT